MKTMRKYLSITITVLLLTLTIVSCNIFQTDDKKTDFELSFADFEKVGVIHNEGLDLIKNYISENRDILRDRDKLINKINELSVLSSNIDEEINTLPLIDLNVISLSTINFVDEKFDNDKSTDLLSANSISDPSGLIPDTLWNQFSSTARNFVIELSEIHDSYNSLSQLYFSIENFVMSVQSSSIIEEEKIALFTGAYTAYYSNEYWTYNNDDWEALHFDDGNSMTKSLHTANSSSSSWRTHVRADIGGGIVGGAMGARAGAIAGATAGGVGALPGAVSGAVSGGIAGSVGASAASIVLSWF
ncbi:hypothetical protein [Rhodohalobacter mucosus]|uniref:Uncharacterized protein n=1 Tax=Rhodohalobacter mucosus TaxID=2079485 RepID=A0A316TV56_9BACT|nr:hypothetical protein [Rhodohalobacter mucosus]PWN07149.1 hypothetical protein DDZ15_07755 [Rhodohalobacter mucosus]